MNYSDVDKTAHSKADNTFSRVMDDINKYEKVFAEGKPLEKAILTIQGDTSWLKDVREALSNAYEALEEAHYGTMGHIGVDEGKETKKPIKESVLDSDDDDGFMARSQLYFLARDAINLHGLIDDRSDLEPWVQSKIAQASKDIDAVRRYTEYNAMDQAQEPEVPALIPGEEPQEEMPSMDMEMPYEAVSEQESPISEAKKEKMKVSKADKDLNTKAYQEYKKGNPNYEYDKDAVKDKENVKEEMKFDDNRDAELKVFAKDLYKKAVSKAKSKANK